MLSKTVHSSLLLSTDETVGWAGDYLAEFKATVVCPGLSRPPLVERWLLALRLVALDIAEAMALLRDVQLALDYGFIRFAVRQIANLVAHSLAIFAPSLVSDYILFDDVPSSVLYLVSKDICG
ncbi:hypothetical protein ACOSQ3_016652 [Xanthoceras sorbifolium]